MARRPTIGWAHQPSREARAFLGLPTGERPDLPSVMQDGKVQSEEIRAAKPDLILDYGSTSARCVERAARVQGETGIPVLLLDGKLERAPEIYRLLGPLLKIEERANDLATAAERLLAITRDRAQARHQAGEISVYYARSADGLTTATSASPLTNVLRLLGAANVADAASAGSGELTHVSREQVFTWNFDFVVTSNSEFRKARGVPEWRKIPAIAEGRVYLAQSLPFGWIDEPPSIKRLLGLLWAGHALYPAAYTEDITSAARDFYRHFYRVDLDTEQIRALLP